MKYFTLIQSAVLAATVGLSANAQWSSVGFPSNMVWQAGELNGKLYVATGGAGLQEMNGSTWTTLANFNNSSNTPNKQKTSVVAIDGLLYAGAGDFNTSGEGTIHTYDGTVFSDLQNSDFYYNGQYEINDFVEYNNEVYAGGIFNAPTGGAGDVNVAKWTGTDWVGVGTSTLGVSGNQNNAVSRLLVFQNKLYVISTKKVLFYDGTTWDSIPYLYDSYTHAAVYNGDLYLCGSLYTYNGSGTPTGTGTVAKWNGTALSIVHSSSGPYGLVHRLFSDGTNLYATAKVTAQGNDVYLVRYDGSTWSNLAFLADAAGGYIPGYPIYDYNHIFKFNNELYVGGRFATINDQAIQSLAKISATSGINKSSENKEAKVYPNPASSAFTIELNENSNDARLIVTDLNGQQVLVQELNSPKTTISTAPLTAGIYFFQVGENGNLSHSGKLIIE